MNVKKIPLLDLISIKFPEYDRERLFSMILAGKVRVDGDLSRDPKRRVSGESEIRIDSPARYVSRGGDKLEHAIVSWNIDCRGMTFLDCGSSTGGFTDCLLAHGAATVYSIDVGYNQLSYRLRTDPRVRVFERTNIMDCVPAMFDPNPGAAVCDLSFRSVTRAASRILGLVGENGYCISLVKPQFEWKNPSRDFRGVVPDEEVFGVASSVVSDLSEESVRVKDALVSPVRGRDGNKELLFLLVRDEHADPENAREKLRVLLG